MDELPPKFAALMREELSWAKLQPEYARIYRESFDQAEVDGLLAFYASPSGQAMLDKMPTVMQKTLAFTQQQMASWLPRIQQLVEQALEEGKVTK